MQNDLGFYVVNGIKYSNKIQAVLEAQKTLAEIKWEFHNEKFNQINWQVDPAISLKELYRIRCQQIRDQYDYVVVMCSGGADSTNVIKSFLYNNIHVDEVIAGAPMSGLKGWDWNDKNTDVTNTISETKYALFPLLEEIAHNYPKVKITVNDYFEDITKFETDKWIYDCRDWVNPAVASRARLDKFKHLVDLADAGKRIAVVWGIDKPIMKYDRDGDMYCIMNDLGVNNAHPPFENEYTNVDRILFYWAPDLPELLAKQCHEVAKFIHRKENLWIAKTIQSLTDGRLWKPEDPGFRKNFNWDYQRAYNPVIYPNTWDNLFQCKKAGVSFMPGQHHWINILHKDSRLCQLIESDFSLFYKSINPKYLDMHGTGFKRYEIKFNIGNYKNWFQS
jgi:hypothetical protein